MIGLYQNEKVNMSIFSQKYVKKTKAGLKKNKKFCRWKYFSFTFPTYFGRAVEMKIT
jgi:hypothetical protein